MMDKRRASELQTKEKVIWGGSRGYLGAFFTNRHFFVISTASGAWQAMPLKLDESKKGVTSLSPYIALLATKDRAIGFDAMTNRFIESQLPFHEDLLAAEAERYVAVIITSSRAFALATESAAFIEIKLQLNETIESFKLTESKVTIRTSDRLLSFEAAGSTWNEHRL